MGDYLWIRPSKPSYRELRRENIHLKGKLRETRKSNEHLIRWMITLAMLFGVSGTLLALTWTGLIVI